MWSRPAHRRAGGDDGGGGGGRVSVQKEIMGKMKSKDRPHPSNKPGPHKSKKSKQEEEELMRRIAALQVELAESQQYRRELERELLGIWRWANEERLTLEEALPLLLEARREIKELKASQGPGRNEA